MDILACVKLDYWLQDLATFVSSLILMMAKVTKPITVVKAIY